MSDAPGFNPVWIIAAVNLIALFVVPFVTYRYAHRNNVKILREKWLSELRGASSGLVGACSKLYYANDMRYTTLSAITMISDADRKALISKCEEAQAEVEGVKAKIELLFKEDDPSFKSLFPFIGSLIESVDKPRNLNGSMSMDSSYWTKALKLYLTKVNEVLHKEWDSITK